MPPSHKASKVPLESICDLQFKRKKVFVILWEIILHIGQDSRGHKFTHDLYFYSLTVCVVRAQNTILTFKAKKPNSINTTVALHTLFKVRVKMHIWPVL